MIARYTKITGIEDSHSSIKIHGGFVVKSEHDTEEVISDQPILRLPYMNIPNNLVSFTMTREALDDLVVMLNNMIQNKPSIIE